MTHVLSNQRFCRRDFRRQNSLYTVQESETQPSFSYVSEPLYVQCVNYKRFEGGK
jgi:hypothetical protein